MTSLNLNYPLQGPVAKYSYFRVITSTQESGGGGGPKSVPHSSVGRREHRNCWAERKKIKKANNQRMRFFQHGRRKNKGSRLGEAFLHQDTLFRGSRAALDTVTEAMLEKPWLCSI